MKYGWISVWIGGIVLYACSARKQEWCANGFLTALHDQSLTQTYLSKNPRVPVETEPVPVASTEPDSFYDSLCKVWIDTSTLKGKRLYIMNQFLIQNEPSQPMYDSLFDLNYDGCMDYVIGYYGQCGNGVKNRVEVHLYDTTVNCYTYSSWLSGITNPSFYINQKKITGFYMAYGGGDGCRFEWIEGKWEIAKAFEVWNEGDTSKWHIAYPLKNALYVQVRPYVLIPHTDILETKIDTNYDPMKF
ncbi:MAG TPA: hypothetical protein VD905_00845 [Flavobacteriales bacterium]|nr:hypothetical protein [Flavobacteriales bacterium]